MPEHVFSALVFVLVGAGGLRYVYTEMVLSRAARPTFDWQAAEHQVLRPRPDWGHPNCTICRGVPLLKADLSLLEKRVRP